MMEDTGRVELEISNGDLEKAPIANRLGSYVNKEDKIAKNGTDALEEKGADTTQENDTLDDQLQAKGANGSELVVEVSSAMSENKASNLSKKAGIDQDNHLKNMKAQKLRKDGAGRNDAAVNFKNPKTRLSQSLSFPVKSSLACGPSKSTTLKQTNVDANSLGANNSEVASSGGPIARETNFDATVTARQSLPVNTGSVDDSTSSVATHHTSHMAVQRRSTSGFSFRLNERAEKRKEFFMKLEEKDQAKELEKNSMQAKSKENQEAELRQLRKSLTFKATPMPSFYQEPIPPKVELKKIPPTRARSPRLGRHKPSSTAANSSEVNGSTQTLETDANLLVKQNGGGTTDTAAPKRTAAQKSISRLPSQNTAVARPEAKLTGSKTKASNMKRRVGKANVEENENRLENEIEQVESPPADAFARVEQEVAETPAEVPIECTLISSEPLTNPGEVPIEA